MYDATHYITFLLFTEQEIRWLIGDRSHAAQRCLTQLNSLWARTEQFLDEDELAAFDDIMDSVMSAT